MARVGKVHKIGGGNGGNSVRLGIAGRFVGGVVLIGRLVNRVAIPPSRLVRAGGSTVTRSRRLVGTGARGIVRRCGDIGLGRCIGIASNRRIGIVRRRGLGLIGVTCRRRVRLRGLLRAGRLRAGRNRGITGGSGLLGITRGVRSPRRHVIAIAFLLATVARIGPLLLLIARNTRLGRIVGPGRAHTRYHAG